MTLFVTDVILVMPTGAKTACQNIIARITDCYAPNQQGKIKNM